MAIQATHTAHFNKTDAALSSSGSALAVITRDNRGTICNAWTKVLSHRSPFQAEAEALLWAFQIAKRERWSNIILESDSKISIDSLSSSSSILDWCIRTTILKVSVLARSFALFFRLGQKVFQFCTTHCC